ncbi:MAG: hypothetical protein M3R02_12340 [Chloroflexota bacterium]|nr:hypothetical protein [Chloroflexota bacterium]
MRFGDYDFMGPFIFEGLGRRLLEFPGVYVVTLGDWTVLDVGEAEDVDRRVTNNHERESCWRFHSGGGGPFIHARMEHGGLHRRRAIEAELRILYKPRCIEQ